jgi:hypothetical protein
MATANRAALMPPKTGRSGQKVARQLAVHKAVAQDDGRSIWLSQKAVPY